MSTVGTTQPRRRRQMSSPHVPAPPAETLPAVWLTQATDAVLVVTLVAVPACFAGRSPLGQLLFASLAALLALLWSMRQLTAQSPVWRSTATVWLWGAGVLLAVVQMIPLSQAWLDWFSPEISRLLILWRSDTSGLLPSSWKTLSLNPAETSSGLASFLAHALLFLAVVQRIRQRSDVAWLLKVVTCAGAAMAVFGLLQFYFSNGLFWWVYQHPAVSTTDTVLGTFTNRNHLAQFLALTIGPALWWLSQAARPREIRQQVGFGGPSPQGNSLQLVMLACGLGAMLLAGSLSLSRAGIAAMAVSSLVGLSLLSLRGHLPGKIIPTVLLVGAGVGGCVLATNYHSLADRFDNMIPDERTTIWAANLRLACRFPWFGTGIGTHLFTHQLETDRQDDNQEFSHAESGYLQVASECGFVGLGIAVLMIGVCLNWCRRAYRTDAGPESSAMAAAILASLAANLLHAGVDFFWYTPGCMVIVAVLAACACRLSQCANGERGVPEPARHPPRLVWGMSVFGLTALAAWMISVKLPGMMAEPHLVEYLNLQEHGEDLADSPEDLERLKIAATVAAARANPHDCRSQLRAAAAYLLVFGQRQEASDNPLSLDQLRDAALASEFESAQALNTWLEAAAGTNRKYLKAARHYARKALMICPLEGQGYLYLSQLEFLRDPQEGLAESLRQQALAVRPYDATIDFEIGRAASWKNETETAMHFWRKAFQRSPEYRRTIADALAANYSAEELIEQLQPDRQGLYALVFAYSTTGRADDLTLIRRLYAQACLEDAPQFSGVAAENIWLEAVRMARDENDSEQAVRIAGQALERMSQSLELHKTLGQLLLEQEDFAGAAQHLQWAALRAPEDAGLQELAAAAVKEKVRRQQTSDNVTPAGHRALR